MRFLYHPDTVLTASELETVALGLLAEIPIPGVEGCGFDSGIIRQTLLQAAVDQKSIKAVTDTNRYLAGFVLCRAKPLIVAVTPVRGNEPKSDAVERVTDWSSDRRLPHETLRVSFRSRQLRGE